ncbi:MAG: hypothetical protein HGA19_13310, partial [Oscillochloris sp.]|nr:hypothetical protein [Oscillochloris sp.]
PADRPSAKSLTDTLDQILALRLARRLVIGLLLLVSLALLADVAMFLPSINLPRQVRALEGERAAKQSALETANQGLTNIKIQTGQATEDLVKVREDIRREEERLAELRNMSSMPFPAIAIPLVGGVGTTTNVLSKDTMTQFWTFELTSTQRVTIEATPLSRDQDGSVQGLEDPVLFLYDHSGKIIGYSDDITYGHDLDARITTDDALPPGIYTIQVTSYKYDNDDEDSPALGDYQITIRP